MVCMVLAMVAMTDSASPAVSLLPRLSSKFCVLDKKLLGWGTATITDLSTYVDPPSSIRDLEIRKTEVSESWLKKAPCEERYHL